MAHANAPALRKMINEGVIEGIELVPGDLGTCEACIQAHHARQPFPTERESPPPTKYGERVHSDVWGPAQTKSLGGNSYAVSFIDDYTDEAVMRFMPAKSDVFEKCKAHEARAKTQRGVKAIQELQLDRGGEYLSKPFTEHLLKKGTVRRLTAHDSPQQNGRSERFNRTCAEHTKAMLLDAKLPKSLWCMAWDHAMYL
jgi:transposase InsO family protein